MKKSLFILFIFYILLAKLIENVYWIVTHRQRHKKTLGSGWSLATVLWSLSTAASDT